MAEPFMTRQLDLFANGGDQPTHEEVMRIEPPYNPLNQGYNGGR